MEKSGREKQQKIRYMREGNTQRTITPMHGVEVTQSVTDVDMHTVQLSWKAEAKEDLKRHSSVSGIYWGLVTAGYMAWSFITMRWDRTWIVWPIAAVAYAAIFSIAKAMRRKEG